MKQRIHPDAKVTISKVKLTNYDEDLKAEDQMTGLELGYIEELLNDENALDFVKEHPTTKLRNFLTHNDLIEKFEALRLHMALICEYADDMDDIDDFTPKDWAKVFVTQITITGQDENAGVVLTGFRLLADGSKLNLNTPNVKFEHTDYQFGRELSDAVDDLTAEAMLALTDRKRKIVQTELFDDEAAVDDEGGLRESLFDNEPGEPIEKLKRALKKHGATIITNNAEA